MKILPVIAWAQFQEIVSSQLYREWMYRGQSSSSWKLESSLFRVLNKNQEIRKYEKIYTKNLVKETYEKEIINHFINSSHLYLSSVPDKKNAFNWLSVMQHYGTPTRMLDFTFSPYVALFFALSGIKDEAAVYCIRFRENKKIDKGYNDITENKMNKIMEKKGKISINEATLIPFEPSFSNARLQAQQGAFLIPNTLNFSHNAILDDGDDDSIIKLTINIEDIYNMLEALLKMNISYTNLYPGLEGFCKSFENIGIIPIKRLKPINKS